MVHAIHPHFSSPTSGDPGVWLAPSVEKLSRDSGPRLATPSYPTVYGHVSTFGLGLRLMILTSSKACSPRAANLPSRVLWYSKGDGCRWRTCSGPSQTFLALVSTSPFCQTGSGPYHYGYIQDRTVRLLKYAGQIVSNGCRRELLKCRNKILSERLDQFAAANNFMPIIVKALYAFSTGVWGLLGSETSVSSPAVYVSGLLVRSVGP